LAAWKACSLCVALSGRVPSWSCVFQSWRSPHLCRHPRLQVQRRVEGRRLQPRGSPGDEPLVDQGVVSRLQHAAPAVDRYGRHEADGLWRLGHAWGRQPGSPSSSSVGDSVGDSAAPDFEEAAAAAGSEQESSEEEAGLPARASQPEAGPAPGLLVAVSNPLFGASRPGSAATQAMPGMLPRKAPLARRSAPGHRSKGRPSGGGASGEPGEPRRLPDWRLDGPPSPPRLRQSPQDSGGATLQSLGSLGSGFGGVCVLRGGRRAARLRMCVGEAYAGERVGLFLRAQSHRAAITTLCFLR
jgi:hypothetical protein